VRTSDLSIPTPKAEVATIAIDAIPDPILDDLFPLWIGGFSMDTSEPSEACLTEAPEPTLRIASFRRI
jgi:hypothetical protein